MLLVAAERAILYLFEGAEIGHAYIFAPDETGLNAFSRCLAELEPAPLAVLVDVVEEEFRQDTIPHVTGADRRSVLERKYARLFRGTPYHHALIQGRESGERRDDTVLLTAITRPEVLAPWLERLNERETPVVGIYSLPLMSERLLKRIGATGPNVLLISLQKASGLRQTFFRDGQIKISRLAYMPRLGSVPFAAHLMGEVEKLRRYLNSLALISRDSPLNIYILSHGQLLSELEQHCRDTDQEKFLLLDVEDVGRRLGLKQSGESHFADMLFAKLMVSRTPPNHYATSDETQFYAMHRTRIALAVAGLVLLLASAGLSGFNFIEGVIFREQALDAAQKAEFYQQRFEMARQKLPATPVEPREIKVAVDAVGTLAKYRSSPEPVMRLLGGALTAMPDVRLDELSWRTRMTAAEPLPGQAPAPAPVGGAPYDYYQEAEFKGHLEPFFGDYRVAMDVIDRLAATLRAHESVEQVEVVQYPLDVRSDSSVSGTTTASNDRAEANFRLRLVMGVHGGGQES
ncbi:MAG: hypothetical protein ACU85V_12560 [Gammaproteobacteria bacterium]